VKPEGPQPVVQQVLRQSELTPDKPAVCSAGHSITYSELAAQVAGTSNILKNRYRVGRGDRVILMAASQRGFISSYLAVHNIGAISVPLDPRIAPARLADVNSRIAPSLTIVESPLPGAHNETITFESLVARSAPPMSVETARPEPRQTADILFTTGTTGQSKGVELSHEALAAACSHINAFIGTTRDDIEVLPLPLSHSFGLGRVRCILSVGGTLVLSGDFVSAAGVLAAIGKYAATGLAMVPAGVAILLADKGAALSRYADQLKYVEIGSSTMSLEHKRLLMTALPNTRICMHYGLTEASRSAYISFHDDVHKLDSIGRPSAGVGMRIVGESNAALEHGTEGIVEISGRHLMSRYWMNPELTASTLRDGWLRTGDIGSVDADGYFYLRGRTSDVMNVGGRKVSPQEIEAILETHPAVSECACVGVPDPQGLSGELISAFLVAEPTHAGELPRNAELAGLLRKTLEPYKIPRRFTWVAELPRSASGKLLRQQLRDGSIFGRSP
jgi:long-chain acyl-CoA synthetase